MLPTAHAYSSFAAKDIAAEKEFYAKKLGLDVNELYDGQLLELRLGDDMRVLVYSKEDFRPATSPVLNFPVPDVDAAVAELQQNGVEMARFDGFDQDAKGIARPTSAGEGPTIAWFRDPDGNILAIHSDEPPPAGSPTGRLRRCPPQPRHLTPPIHRRSTTAIPVWSTRDF